MENWFDEKTQQVMPDTITAFGIKLVSRYGQAGELRDMLLFAELAAEEGLADRVDQLFYDSKACLCIPEFVPGYEFGSPDDAVLFKCALKSLTQFQWDETIYHRDSPVEPD
jgi:hypothetical protein